MMELTVFRLNREYDLLVTGGLKITNACYVGPGLYGTMRFDAEDGTTYWLLPSQIESVRARNDVIES